MKPHKSIKDTIKKVAVVIPCHNESKSIAMVISKFPENLLTKHNLKLKLYVIDNNSSDDTYAIAKKAGAIVIKEPKKGKGNAMKAGFQRLPRDIDYVVMLDGDNTYSPEELPRMLEPLRSNFCDVVVGSRLSGQIKTAAMNRVSRAGNQFFTFAVRQFYGANVTDVLTGYFAWKKPVLDSLEPHIKSSGFAIEMEMITKMARMGFKMTSVPITYDPRIGETHLHPLMDGSRILRMFFKNLRWRPERAPRLTHAKLPENAKISASKFIPRKMVFVSDAIYPYMKGGKEKRLHEITKRLAAMGHNVHIYTMHWWDEPDKIRYEDGVYLHALCNYHEMYIGDRRTIKEGVVFGLACFKLIRVSFDVLDVDHMPFFPIISSWLVCKLRGRKLYATWHEALSKQDWIGYMGRGGVIASLIERLSIRLPHRITAASTHTKELLASIHGRVNRVEMVDSGIDMSLISHIRSSRVRCDVLYVGRLVKDKNLDKLIIAIDIIAKTKSDIQCLILGSGIDLPRLTRLVARRKLENNVKFMDSVDEDREVYAIMKAAKVFCSPSTREGFGIVSLEALACGTPVITIDSPTNAARNLVRNGYNGSIVPLKSAAIADAILYWDSIVQKPDIASYIAERDWYQLAQKQADVYSL